MKRLTTLLATASLALTVTAASGCDKGGGEKKGPAPAPVGEAPKGEAPKGEAPKGEAPKGEAPKGAGDAAPDKKAPDEPAAAAKPTTAGEPPAIMKAPTPPPEAAPYDAKENAGEGNEALKDPSKLTEEAPATFKAKFETTAGDWTVECTREWAPKGADRLYNMIKAGFFEDIAMFRAIRGFMVQFGIHGNPGISAAWREAMIPDDPVKQSNKRGVLTFAMAGPNTRTTQLFINFADNSRLDPMGFPGVCQVVEGMETVDKVYTGYGEGAPRGMGPDQGRVQMQGNAYLKKDFPKLDYIKKVTLL